MQRGHNKFQVSWLHCTEFLDPLLTCVGTILQHTDSVHKVMESVELPVDSYIENVRFDKVI